MSLSLIRRRKWFKKSLAHFQVVVRNVAGSEAAKSQFAILSEKFHKPGENHLTEGYVTTPNTKRLLEQHLKETGGKVITRFPPEPNGFLHIGHAMAMNFSFNYAKVHGGITYLRFDDTNPETAQELYVKDILKMVEWLGYTPHKITYASDYFPQLYKYASSLIARGYAYVCHQPLTQQDNDSHWRDRDSEESLKLFEVVHSLGPRPSSPPLSYYNAMKNGCYSEGEATLRMKLRLMDGKHDPVAYRIKKTTPHLRTGDQWCIYPTYDFAHCLCDSIENITHSFCSKEFMIKKYSYYWLCNVLDVYCPVQWEFSRLNISHALLSKRKIQKLLTESVIKNWDDPRLYTLSALRRRGFPPEAINAFCEQYGVLQSDGKMEVKLVDHFVRKHLNVTVNRVMAITDPIKVTIINFPWKEGHTVKIPNNRNCPSSGTRIVPFTKTIFIEQADFREDSPKGYKRLTLKQPVGLKYAHCMLRLEHIVKDRTGQPVELQVTCHSLPEPTPRRETESLPKASQEDVGKPKAFIHWLSEAVPCTLRLYQERSCDEIGEDSLHEVSTALIEKSAQSCSPGTTLQFERIGYFCVDPDSTSDRLVLNRTLNLHEKADNLWPVLPDPFSTLSKRNFNA